MARFIDEATITIRSGNGGAGCVAFRREKYVPRGGPAGGDGGKGGDVWFAVDHNLATLLDFRYRRAYEAPNGKPGQGSNKAGPDGEDVVVCVPLGTILKNAETGEIVADLSDPGARILICKGGRGGKGNSHFATSTHQAPKFAQPGEPGEEKVLKLELKLLADVGLVGYPNAGKSTLISKISAARPKIADYAFTTLTPNLGVVRIGKEVGSPTFVVADVPGLIEGASLGRGLGTKFLKHLERTVLLVHLIDGAKLLKEFGADDAAEIAKGAVRDKEILDAELNTFSPELSSKEQILAFNKADLYDDRFLEDVRKEMGKLGYKDVLLISGAAHIGLDPLLDRLAKRLFGPDGLKRTHAQVQATADGVA
ncbi:MAG: GTPase ObgE [Deltaproteobacteria bacterium]|nr:GTPase ObgE [Deltaproteobacteria bacterium]